ncbi:MAG: thioredoxin fold domain-containing protein [Gammaproteobacteria bacterium]|nr:thioredoxin fold domain-containing protein [Gammaproteobacteria bacterium]
MQVAHATGKVTGSLISKHPSWFKESFLDISEDVSEAKDNDKHVILFMHLNGCPYCYKMTEENLKNAPYTNFIKENFEVIALNIKGDREVSLNEDISLTEKALAEHFKVLYTPTVIFLNTDNKIVARINGYRNIDDFKQILDYVQSKSYLKTSLAKFIDERKKEKYVFQSHPLLMQSDDLQSLKGKPLALIFEDKSCKDCSKLHEGYLKDPDVNEVLKKMNFVRLDALSNQSIKDIHGNKTTPKDLAETLKLSYRPGIILYDQGKEIMRIESMLYKYHFTEVLRYVAEGHYKKYPKSFYDYLDVRTAELVKQGVNIDIGK